MMSCIKIFWILIAISCTIEAYRMKEEELETLEEVRIPTHSTLIFKGLSTNSYIKNISQKSLLFLTEIG